MVISEVKIVDGKYVGFYRGEAITTQNSLEKCFFKLMKYAKGLK